MLDGAPALESEHIPGRSAGRRHDRDRARLLTIEHLDGRTKALRAVRQCEAQILEDLGGEDATSEAQRQLAARAAVLTAVLEHEEVRWTAGEPFDLARYATGVNCLRRVLCAIGLERKMRPVDRLAQLMGSD